MAEASLDSTTTKLLSASLRNFSDESVHQPGMLTALSDMSLAEESVVKFLVTAFYGNGDTEENRGHVSIVFKCRLPLIFKSHHHFNFSCVAAVEDSAGGQRFVRSFTFPYDPEVHSATAGDLLATYRIERYVAREALLADPETLLPGDRLQLRVEVTLHTISPDDFVDYDALVASSFSVEEDPDGEEVIRLSLDSKIAARFREESDVFRAMCDADMAERRQGYVRLAGDQPGAFRQACRILAGARSISFDSLDGIVLLYMFAEKYHVRGVLRRCREFFQKALHARDAWGTFERVADRVEKVVNVAKVFGDSGLLETVDLFLRKWREDPVDVRRHSGKELQMGHNLKVEYTGLSPYLYFDLEDTPEEDGSQLPFYS